MDKSVGRDKRRKDKHHKKPPPVKSTLSVPNKPAKESGPTPTPLIVYDDPYSRRPIEFNWNSAKNLPSSEGSDSEDEQLRAADFEKLLQMPSSTSGHFFLSTEKHWISESEQGVTAGGKSGQHFQVDTRQLIASLATIPFYERNDYPIEIFSKQEIDSMKLKAQYEAKKYDELCQRLKSTSNKMSDKQKTPKPPVKCLFGADALPSASEGNQQESTMNPPARPMPCLIGPMALPPELRNNHNVTGSYASSTAQVTERLSDVNLGEVRNHGTVSVDESVPIASDDHRVEETSIPKDQQKEESKAGRTSSSSKKETKEDMQQWLDDILDM